MDKEATTMAFVFDLQTGLLFFFRLKKIDEREFNFDAKKSNNGLCSLQIRHSLFFISLLVNGRKKGIEYKKSTMSSRDLSHQFYCKAIFMFTSEKRKERKLLFRPDQQYSRSARLVSCIGINVFHNQNIHFDKRNQIAEI